MPYIVVLGPAATRIMLSLTPFDQRGLDRALNDELFDGPNADKEIRFDSNGYPRPCDNDSRSDTVYYTATPLSHKAYTAIHRPMTKAELGTAGTAQHDHATDLGFYVLDILAAKLAFEPWTPLEPWPRLDQTRIFEFRLAVADVIQHAGNIPLNQELHEVLRNRYENPDQLAVVSDGKSLTARACLLDLGGR